MPIPLILFETLCSIYGKSATEMFYFPVAHHMRGRPARGAAQ